MKRKKISKTISEKEQLSFIVLAFVGFAFLSQIPNMYKFSILNANLNIIFYSLIGGVIGVSLVYKYKALYKQYRTFFIASLGFLIGFGLASSYSIITFSPILSGILGIVLSVMLFESVI